MAAAVPLRSDFDAGQLRTLAKGSRNPNQTRRLLALAAISEGASCGSDRTLGLPR